MKCSKFLLHAVLDLLLWHVTNVIEVPRLKVKVPQGLLKVSLLFLGFVDVQVEDSSAQVVIDDVEEVEVAWSSSPVVCRVVLLLLK